MLGPLAGGGEKVAALRSCPGGWSLSLAYLRLARLIHRRFIQQASERPLLGTAARSLLQDVGRPCKRRSLAADLGGFGDRLQVQQNGSLGPIGPSQTARHLASLGLQFAGCDEL